MYVKSVYTIVSEFSGQSLNLRGLRLVQHGKQSVQAAGPLVLGLSPSFSNCINLIVTSFSVFHLN